VARQKAGAADEMRYTTAAQFSMHSTVANFIKSKTPPFQRTRHAALQLCQTDKTHKAGYHQPTSVNVIRESQPAVVDPPCTEENRLTKGSISAEPSWSRSGLSAAHRLFTSVEIIHEQSTQPLRP